VLQIESNFSSNSGYRQGAEAWRANRTESPAGGMTSLGVHALDAMIHLGGTLQRVQVYSRHLALPIDIDDTTAILCEFDQGALGFLGTVYASAPFWRLHVFGSEGWAEMRGLDVLVTATRAGKVEETKFPPCDTVKLELEGFAQAVEQGTPPPTIPADEIVHGVAALEAIATSAASGQPVAVA
jgi:predicted dehydrogenase